MSPLSIAQQLQKSFELFFFLSQINFRGRRTEKGMPKVIILMLEIKHISCIFPFLTYRGSLWGGHSLTGLRYREELEGRRGERREKREGKEHFSPVTFSLNAQRRHFFFPKKISWNDSNSCWSLERQKHKRTELFSFFLIAVCSCFNCVWGLHCYQVVIWFYSCMSFDFGFLFIYV